MNINNLDLIIQKHKNLLACKVLKSDFNIIYINK